MPESEATVKTVCPDCESSETTFTAHYAAWSCGSWKYHDGTGGERSDECKRRVRENLLLAVAEAAKRLRSLERQDGRPLNFVLKLHDAGLELDNALAALTALRAAGSESNKETDRDAN